MILNENNYIRTFEKKIRVQQYVSKNKFFEDDEVFGIYTKMCACSHDVVEFMYMYLAPLIHDSTVFPQMFI